MVAQRIADLLTESVTRTLETMFFAEAVPEPPTGGPADFTGVGAQVCFHGSLRGVFAVVAEEEVARQLALGFLGVDDATEAEVRSVIGELANMTCGSLLSRLSEHALFRLDTPQAIDVYRMAASERSVVRLYRTPPGMLLAALERKP